MKLSEESRKLLLSTAVTYHNQLKENPEPAQYLADRGLTEQTVKRFGLGLVAEPAEPVDEPFTGRISIPYLTNSPVHGHSCIGFKFRLTEAEESKRKEAGQKVKKYLYRKGLTPSLFNPAALLRDTEFICVTEGEIDAISAEQAGLPTVGIPGATQWETWFPRLFRGYKAVYFLQDADEAGEQMAEKWAKEVRNVKVIVMPEGDVNGTLAAQGESNLKGLIFLPANLTTVITCNKGECNAEEAQRCSGLSEWRPGDD